MENASIMLDKARQAEEIGEYSKAISLLEELENDYREVFPFSILVKIELARSRILSGDMTNIDSDIEKITTLIQDSDNVDITIRLKELQIQTLIARSQYEEALALGLEISEIAKDNAKLNIWLQLQLLIGNCYFALDDLENAKRHYSRVIDEHQEIGVSIIRAKALTNTGNYYKAKGNNAETISYYERARDMFSASGHIRGMLWIQNSMADSLNSMGRYSEALDQVKQVVVIASEKNMVDILTWSLVVKALIEFNLQDYTAMRDSALAAKRVHEESELLGDGYIEVLGVLAQSYIQLEEYENASEILSLAFDYKEKTQSPIPYNLLILSVKSKFGSEKKEALDRLYKELQKRDDERIDEMYSALIMLSEEYIKMFQINLDYELLERVKRSVSRLVTLLENSDREDWKIEAMIVHILLEWIEKPDSDIESSLRKVISIASDTGFNPLAMRASELLERYISFRDAKYVYETVGSDQDSRPRNISSDELITYLTKLGDLYDF